MPALRSEIPSGMCAKLRTVAASNNRDHPTRSLSSSPFASTINCSPGSQALFEVTHQDHSIGITLLLLVRATYIYFCSSRTSRSWWIIQSTQHRRRGCNTSDIDGKHDITAGIKKKLKEKHPKAAELKQSAIIDKPKTKTERVIFENITQDEIASNTKNSSGSGGPWQIDMHTWSDLICSKSYGTHSQMLADKIATLARRLATDTIPHDYISTLLACKLVPLKKKNGMTSRCWWMLATKHGFLFCLTWQCFYNTPGQMWSAKLITFGAEWRIYASYVQMHRVRNDAYASLKHQRDNFSHTCLFATKFSKNVLHIKTR